METYFEDIERIALSAVFGAVIGLEREWRGKPAGLRTLMLVSLGATLFTIVSYRMQYEISGQIGDVTRIASNIVTGIGFLGAGLIFKGDNTVQGLTTSATVWSAAAIGMAVGVGMYEVAAAATALSWIILVLVNYFERYFETVAETRTYQITYESSLKTDMLYEDFFKDKKFKLLEKKMEKNKDCMMNIWTLRAPKKIHDEATKKMILDERIKELKY